MEAYIPDIIPDGDLQMFEKAGMGRRGGFGEKLAIVVVDMTRGAVEDRFPLAHGKTGKPAVKAIKKLLDVAREIGIPIFYARNALQRTEAETGSWSYKIAGHATTMQKEEAHEIPDEISPRDGDTVIIKYKPSAFFGTAFESLLKYYNVDTLIVTGMTTSGCVRATVVDASSYNYRVIVPIECVADRGTVSHQVSLFDMDMKYADVTPLSEVLKSLENLDKSAYKRKTGASPK